MYRMFALLSHDANWTIPFSQSNSDSDEDYILIEKEEGVAAEAAAEAAAVAAEEAATLTAEAADLPAVTPATDTSSQRVVSPIMWLQLRLQLLIFISLNQIYLA